MTIVTNKELSAALHQSNEEMSNTGVNYSRELIKSLSKAHLTGIEYNAKFFGVKETFALGVELGLRIAANRQNTDLTKPN